MLFLLFVFTLPGFYKVLSQLTLAGDVTAEQFTSKSSLTLNYLTEYVTTQLLQLNYRIDKIELY